MRAPLPLADENRVPTETHRRRSSVNPDRYVSLLLAVCCIGAAGVASTTLDSTFEQRPDDVVDFDYDEVPIGTDQAAALKDAVQGTEGSSGGDTPSQTGDPTAAESDGSGEQAGSAATGDGDGASDASTGSGSEQSATQSGSGDQQAGADADGSGALTGDGATAPGENPPEPSLLDRLLDLLVTLLPLFVLLIALGLAYRYREYLAALVAGVLARFETQPDGTGETTVWPRREPENEVHGAWLTMVSRAGVERPRQRTPSECAAAAAEAGLDPDAVRTLTDVFEEVRYGEAPVTEGRLERARAGLRGLGVRTDGGEDGRRTPPPRQTNQGNREGGARR